jgi:hypothetical protein
MAAACRRNIEPPFRLSSRANLALSGLDEAMPVALAEYLRHLATRCSRMSRDCTDRVISKELEVISVELVEKAVELEADYAIPRADDSDADIVTRDDDDDN